MTSTDIKNVALALAFGATVALLADVAIQGMSRRPPAGTSGGAMFLVAAMGRLTWVAAAGLLWVVASPVARWLTPHQRGSAPSSPRSGAFRLVGGLMIAVPVSLLVAGWLVAAIKITLVGSWGTEGQIFLAGYYYANLLLLSTGPWLLGGSAVLGAGRLFVERSGR